VRMARDGMLRGMDTQLPAPHVALVDDDPDVGTSLRGLLRACGYRVSLFPGAQPLLAHGLADIDCVSGDTT